MAGGAVLRLLRNDPGSQTMQRGVLLGTGVVVAAVVGFFALRSMTSHKAAIALDQGLEQLQASLPAGTTIRHGATEVNPLTGTLTVHAMVLLRDGAATATAETVTVAGADQQALRDVFDPVAYPNGRPAWTDRKLLLSDVTVENLRVVGRDPQAGDVTVARIVLHRLSGRPFMLPPTPENRAKPEFAADAALALAADSMQEHGIVVTDSKTANRLKIGTTDLEGYDAGRLKSFDLRDMKLDFDNQTKGRAFHMILADFGLKDADLRAPLQGVRQTGHADKSQLGQAAFGSGALSGLVLDMVQGPHLELHDTQVTYSSGPVGPTGGQASLHGLTISMGQTKVPASAAPVLAAFGMNAVTMDIDGASQRNPATRQTELHEDVVLHDLGTFHLQGSFIGGDPALADPDKPAAALLGTTLNHASIVLDDHSLTNRIFAAAAAQMHTTPELVRAQLAMPIVTLALMLPEQQDAADQLTAFLNNPRKLTVTMVPPQPVTLGQVSAAPIYSRARTLGIHIGSN